MKFLLSCIAAATLLGVSIPADAATVNIGSTAGTYDVTSSGTESWGTVSDYFSGTLAAGTTVTFTFTVNATGENNGNKGVSGGGSYAFYENNGVVSNTWVAGYSSYNGGTNAYENPGKSGSSWGGYNDASNSNNWVSLALLLSSANLAADGKSGTVTIANLSDATVNYWVSFVSAVSGYLGQTITYTVSSVASTPLPAALPLFGAAILGLGLLGSRRAKRRT
jgi:hypothetical protein